nr:hypothetical protein [Nitrosopumilus sp.]
MKLKLLLLLLFISHLSYSATYYFSSTTGDDSRTATQAQNPSTPWKTVKKLNAYFSYLAPGDFVLFKRGETFYGGIVISKSGSSGSPITIGAYGSGDKPIITGMTNLSGWVNLGGGIWESYHSALGASVNVVLMNDAPQ